MNEGYYGAIGMITGWSVCIREASAGVGATCTIGEAGPQSRLDSQKLQLKIV